jgi:hypothetical protein
LLRPDPSSRRGLRQLQFSAINAARPSWRRRSAPPAWARAPQQFGRRPVASTGASAGADRPARAGEERQHVGARRIAEADRRSREPTLRIPIDHDRSARRTRNIRAGRAGGLPAPMRACLKKLMRSRRSRAGAVALRKATPASASRRRRFGRRPGRGCFGAVR